jgi:hypothetical protein
MLGRGYILCECEGNSGGSRDGHQVSEEGRHGSMIIQQGDHMNNSAHKHGRGI